MSRRKPARMGVFQNAALKFAHNHRFKLILFLTECTWFVIGPEVSRVPRLLMFRVSEPSSRYGYRVSQGILMKQAGKEEVYASALGRVGVRLQELPCKNSVTDIPVCTILE